MAGCLFLLYRKVHFVRSKNDCRSFLEASAYHDAFFYGIFMILFCGSDLNPDGFRVAPVVSGHKNFTKNSHYSRVTGTIAPVNVV